MRCRAWLAALALTVGLAPVAYGATQPHLPPLANGSTAAPRLIQSGPPLVLSDSPESVASSGLTYVDPKVLDGGAVRLLDYHTNEGSTGLYEGYQIINHGHSNLTLRVGRHAALSSDLVPGLGIELFKMFIASRGQTLAVLAPGHSYVFRQLIPPPGHLGPYTGALQEDLSLHAARGAITATLQTFVSRNGQVPSRVLPQTIGMIRATFPHDTVHAVLGTQYGLSFFDVAGPTIGYAAPDLALPGETEVGYDWSDQHNQRALVYSKGAYGMLYVIRLLVPAHQAYRVLASTSALNDEGLPHTGNAYAAYLDGQVRSCYGAYLPQACQLGGSLSSDATLQTTLLPGAMAPMDLFLTPAVTP